MEYAIETFGLAKSYGRLQALKPIDLRLRLGLCFGLLGPNGAGKSTLVKTLLGIVHASSGSAKLLGVDFKSPQSRRRTGYLPEGHRFPRYLTGREVCRYFGRLSGLGGAALEDEITKKLAMVGMESWGGTKIPKYSKGMMQRVGLAQAMLGDPALILLDEPTDGVDPVGRQEMRGVIRDFCGTGRTVFINSHLLSEIELVCDEVAILHKGEMIHHGSITEIKAQVGGSKQGVDVRFQTGGMPEASWSALSARGAQRAPENSFVMTLASNDAIPPLIDELRAQKIAIYAVEPLRSTLEDAFVQAITAQEDGSVGGSRS
jgi:ABC-2 type transport system ATP-binding protein